VKSLAKQLSAGTECFQTVVGIAGTEAEEVVESEIKEEEGEEDEEADDPEEEEDDNTKNEEEEGNVEEDEEISGRETGSFLVDKGANK